MQLPEGSTAINPDELGFLAGCGIALLEDHERTIGNTAIANDIATVTPRRLIDLDRRLVRFMAGRRLMGWQALQPISDFAHRRGMTTSNLFILARPIIESAVARCVDRTAYSNAELHHACAALVLFVARQSNADLSDQTVFAAPAIESYIATRTDMSPASRGNLRSMLYRMSEVLLGTTGKGDISYALSAASPSEPYSDRERKALERWRAAQSVTRRPSADALFGLGFGAGLSASEVMTVTPADIEFETNDAGPESSVNVAGTRARRVLIDKDWNDSVVRAWQAHQNQALVFCPDRKGAGKNLITNFIARGGDVGLRPNTQRIRASYLVTHINAGDSVTTLIRIAGVKSLDALARYVRFVA
jgi:hypothetical protein